MSSELTGNIRSYTSFRQFEQDNASVIENFGVNDYNLPVVSGTGIGQCNAVYISDLVHSSAGIEEVQLNNLSYNRLGYDFNLSFAGPGGGKIIAAKFENTGPNSLYIKPFWTSGFAEIPPSSTRLASNYEGWEVGLSGTIQTSGNGSVQPYTLSLIGSARKIIVKPSFPASLEYLTSGIADQLPQLEWIGNSFVGPEGTGGASCQLEWITTASGIYQSGLLEFLGIPSGLYSSGQLEFLKGYKQNKKSHLEYLLPSGSSDLPKNREFRLIEEEDGEGDDVDIDNSSEQRFSSWKVAWQDFAEDGISRPTFLKFNGNQNINEDNAHDLCLQVTNIGNTKLIEIGRESPLETTVLQDMAVYSGHTYRFTCRMNDVYEPQDYAGEKGLILFKDGLTGNILLAVNQTSDLPDVVTHDIDGTFVTESDQLRMEMYIPERESWFAEDDLLTFQEQIAKKMNYLSVYDLLLTRLN